MNVHELAERLVSMVADDRGLPGSVRREAGALRDLVTRNPDLELEHLGAITARVVPTLKLVFISNFLVLDFDETPSEILLAVLRLAPRVIVGDGSKGALQGNPPAVW